MRLPKYAYHCFWSYNISTIDPKQDKGLIIEQILNYGDWRCIKWLFGIYKDKEIKKVLRFPHRGSWWRNVLSFWLTIFNLRIPKDTYNLAIREIDPAKVDQKALMRFFKKKTKK